MPAVTAAGVQCGSRPTNIGCPKHGNRDSAGTPSRDTKGIFVMGWRPENLSTFAFNRAFAFPAACKAGNAATQTHSNLRAEHLCLQLNVRWVE